MAEQVKCDFCSGRPVRWRYPARTFKIREYRFGSIGDWAACDTCHGLIQKKDWDGLADRSLQTFLDLHPAVKALVGIGATLGELRKQIRLGHNMFRNNRKGEPIQLSKEQGEISEGTTEREPGPNE